jgi:glycopeptide antibiotics resistance protein
MVFKDVPLIRVGGLMINFGGTHEGQANLLPFKTILPYLLGEKGLMIAGINLIGNIVLLVPIGVLVPFLYRNMTWKKSLALAVSIGFAIEGMQALLHVGIFDIDDVILNGLGVMIGYWAFMILANWVRSGKYKTIIITAIIIITAAVAVLYVVYPKGHQRVNSRVGASSVQPDSVDSGEAEDL